MKIIGITGTLGAGKGTVVDYLVQKKRFKHYSVRAYLIEEIKKRNLEINRDSMRQVADGLREKFGPSYVIEQVFNKAKENGENAIVESIRCPGEVDFLQKNEDFLLLAVDADTKIRYDRIYERKSETDDVTFEKFKEQEAAENNNFEPFKMNLKVCISKADFVLDNGNSLEDLYEKIDEIFS